MRNGVRLPPWLARRGFSAQLKRRLSNAAKARRPEVAQNNSAREAEPQGVGRAIELQQYLTWRMAEVG
jgi:hypothetical protein